MKYLIFSDSHGATLNMRKVIDAHLPELDGVLFLGDLFRDAETLRLYYPDLKIYAVAGNCDGMTRFQEELLDLDGISVLICHGHTMSVKSTLVPLEIHARKLGADIAMFGHTHERFEKYISGEKSLWLFNPGSITQPRDGEQSFGLLTIKDGQFLLSHGNPNCIN